MFNFTRIFLIFLVTVSLVACGGGGGSSSSNNNNGSSGSNNTGGNNTGNTGGNVIGGGTDGEGLEPNPTLAAAPSFWNQGVHDPSVIKDADGTYYVFGSHLSSAKTTDLVQWTRVADGVNDANHLFDTYAQQAAEGIEWVDGWVGSWAADVIQLADGKYYFYYNHCAQNPEGNCVSRSYLGLAKADSVEGPYEHVQLILKTGHRAEDGNDIEGDAYTGNYDPNAIDPDIFYGKDGTLWMVYGSYSGGIFIKQLDPATGLPLDNTSYGTKLTGGFYSAIEGPFILYSPITDYYYLFTSFGGFVSTDGYNVRVARSRTPEGPYLDAAGQDMIGASGGWATIEPFGNKIIGGFNFQSELGLSGTDYGYLAPGHGSALYDEELGKHIMFFHTRFPNRGEQHEIRVHELLVTEDDWLVLSPHRYAPIEGDNIVDAEDIVGTYQFINHEHDINRAAKQSTSISLTADGNVVGTISGSYVLDNNLLTITTNSGNVYRGVASWQWYAQEDMLTVTFSVQSEQGINLWGSKIPVVDSSDALQAIAEEISFSETITAAVELPVEGLLGATISWSSSNPDVISTTGVVTRPAIGQSDANVTLTATISLEGEQLTQSYDLTVKALTGSGLLAHYAFDNDLSDSNNVFANASITGAIYTSAAGGSENYEAGVDGQAFTFDGNTGLRLPTTLINSYEYTVSYWLKPTAYSTYTTSFFAANDTNNWMSVLPQSGDFTSNQSLFWYMDNGTYLDGVLGVKFPLDEWTHIAFTVSNGELTVYVDGAVQNQTSDFPDYFTAAGGDFFLGVNYFSQDAPLMGAVDDLQVYDIVLTQQDIQDLMTK